MITIKKNLRTLFAFWVLVLTMTTAALGNDFSLFDNPWTVFANVDADITIESISDVIPTTFSGVNAFAKNYYFTNNLLDFTSLGLTPQNQSPAIICTYVYSNKNKKVTIGAGADSRMQVSVNGKTAYTTMKSGNGSPLIYYTDHIFDIDLKKGRNIIVIKVLGSNNGWKLCLGNPDDVRTARKLEQENPFGFLRSVLAFYQRDISEKPVPDPLLLPGGTRIITKEQWEGEQRERILSIYKEHIYGNFPTKFDDISFKVTSSDSAAVNSTAIKKVIEVTISNNGKSASFPLTLYIPHGATKFPVFLYIDRKDISKGAVDVENPSFPIKYGIQQGFAMASFWRTGLAPDSKEEYNQKMMTLFPELIDAPNGAKTIGMWAFGVMRSVDYLVGDSRIDSDRIAVIGMSRGGKTAIWAGVNDKRISLVCDNASGEMGSAISRRLVGENIADMKERFSHWFCDNFATVSNTMDELDVDQNMFLSLIAPRSLAVGSRSFDIWADPEGQYLGLMGTLPVYQLYGIPTIDPKTSVKLGKPIMSQAISFHINQGTHSLALKDWQTFFDHSNYLAKNQ
ncbi:alpha/beta hydrolase family protein [Kriegella aquimaris]|uniref:4-O-methyl-glucuronoyl methylesterase-like domain-containing protein n=1 Tax=Kriegella aquimaris TaxID=192904 RepID=A0A1G9TQ96_9FLAO|nr:hypothetical protein [Kriegella aquimaris]SDM49275.1 hypothetical protein SAMN04488514_109138 [Kriegella aquimaris]